MEAAAADFPVSCLSRPTIRVIASACVASVHSIGLVADELSGRLGDEVDQAAW